MTDEAVVGLRQDAKVVVQDVKTGAITKEIDVLRAGDNVGWPSRQSAGAELADGQWHHAAFTWNRAKRQQQLYVDGALVATNMGPEGGGYSGGCTLGRANTGGSFTGGSLDEFRIYSRCLNGDDAKALAR